MTRTLTDSHVEAAITGWVTPAWAAELLGRNKRTIRQWAKNNEIPTRTHPQLGLTVDMASCARLDATRPKQPRKPNRRRRS